MTTRARISAYSSWATSASPMPTMNSSAAATIVRLRPKRSAHAPPNSAPAIAPSSSELTIAPSSKAVRSKSWRMYSSAPEMTPVS